MRSNDQAQREAERFVEIDSNSSGDPICLDSRDGSVRYPNHDTEFTPVFVNSSATALVQTLLMYRELNHETLAGDT